MTVVAIKITKGFMINTGNYNNAKIEVVIDAIVDSETEETYEQAEAEANELLQVQLVKQATPVLMDAPIELRRRWASILNVDPDIFRSSEG